MKPVLALAAVLAAPAWAQDASPCPLSGQVPMLVTEMFFGQSVGPARLIGHRAWRRFVADTVTPAFPDGFTTWSAAGQYRDPATRTLGREPTEVLLVAAPDTPVLRARVAAVAAEFRRRFDQRSVGIVTTPGCAAF